MENNKKANDDVIKLVQRFMQDYYKLMAGRIKEERKISLNTNLTKDNGTQDQ